MRWPIFASIAAAALALAAPALGATKADQEDCRQGGESERRIAGCTRMIEDRNVAPQERALAYNNRAVVKRNRGDVDGAIADYGEAIKLNPRYALAYSNRGVAWLDKRDNDSAMADCEAALKINPRLAPAFNCRGLTWRAKGDYDRAQADCNAALNIAPDYSAGYNCRGLALSGKGEYDRAIADFTEAIRLAPRYFYAHNNRGRAYALKGDQDRAIADYTETIRINPRFRSAYRNRGTAWSIKGDNERATADYTEANRLSSKAASADVPNAIARVGDPASAAPAAAPKAVPAAPSTGLGRRVALVIGNSSYRGVAALANPERDASSVAAALRSVGFATVITKNNASRQELVSALKSFEDQAEMADWAVVYYAGHGIEISGINYLVPVDANLKDDRDVQDEAVPLERVLLSVENAKKLRLVILDACRDNPFMVQMRKSNASRSLGRGLGSIEPEGGVMVAYAAKHGQIAFDGDGAGSPFALALVNRLPTPNLEISLLFRMVRDDVLSATGRRQEPFVYGSLPGESLYFVQR